MLHFQHASPSTKTGAGVAVAGAGVATAGAGVAVAGAGVAVGPRRHSVCKVRLT